MQREQFKKAKWLVIQANTEKSNEEELNELTPSLDDEDYLIGLSPDEELLCAVVKDYYLVYIALLQEILKRRPKNIQEIINDKIFFNYASNLVMNTSAQNLPRYYHIYAKKTADSLEEFKKLPSFAFYARKTKEREQKAQALLQKFEQRFKKLNRANAYKKIANIIAQAFFVEPRKVNKISTKYFDDKS